MLIFLKIANKGISLNSIAFHCPTHVYRFDSCPTGLGGYSHEGFTWRWYLPEDLNFRATNNLLEHLAAIISPWIDILAGRLQSEDCVLLMTDSTTAKGWLRKSNFSELGKRKLQALVRIEAAQKQATLFSCPLESKITANGSTANQTTCLTPSPETTTGPTTN